MVGCGGSPVLDYCSKTFRPVVNLYSECCTADVSDDIVSVER